MPAAQPYAHAGVLVNTGELIITFDQLRDGYAMRTGPFTWERQEYKVIRRLDDGTYLVEEPKWIGAPS